MPGEVPKGEGKKKKKLISSPPFAPCKQGFIRTGAAGGGVGGRAGHGSGCGESRGETLPLPVTHRLRAESCGPVGCAETPAAFGHLGRARGGTQRRGVRRGWSGCECGGSPLGAAGSSCPGLGGHR